MGAGLKTSGAQSRNHSWASSVRAFRGGPPPAEAVLSGRAWSKRQNVGLPRRDRPGFKSPLSKGQAPFGRNLPRSAAVNLKHIKCADWLGHLCRKPGYKFNRPNYSFNSNIYIEHLQQSKKTNHSWRFRMEKTREQGGGRGGTANDQEGWRYIDIYIKNQSENLMKKTLRDVVWTQTKQQQQQNEY